MEGFETKLDDEFKVAALGDLPLRAHS